MRKLCFFFSKLILRLNSIYYNKYVNVQPHQISDVFSNERKHDN